MAMPDAAARATWLDLAAALDELGTVIAVRLSKDTTSARDAHGATHALKPLDSDAIESLIDLLDDCSTPQEGPPDGSCVTRFAGTALTYETFDHRTTLQIHRWPAAQTWRGSLPT